MNAGSIAAARDGRRLRNGGLVTLVLVVFLWCAVGVGTAAGAASPANATDGNAAVTVIVNTTQPTGVHSLQTAGPDRTAVRERLSFENRSVLVMNETHVDEQRLRQLASVDVVTEPTYLYPYEHRERNSSVQGEIVPWGLTRIAATEAAATVTNESSVDVAVIDTGIDTDHPDLPTPDWGINTAGYGTPLEGSWAVDDSNGHGTHVAGTVAAQDNGRGVVGAAPNVDLYVVKAGKDRFRTTDVAQGIEYVLAGPDGTRGTADDADVISLSLGSSNPSPSLHAAVQAARSDAVVVTSAGNSGDGNATTNEVGYPAKYPSTIAVAASNRNDGTVTFSSEGKQIDVAAPGTDILSTYPSGRYARIGGTSMAAPHVSAVAALLVAEHGPMGTDAARRQLAYTASDIGPSGVDNYTGHGLIDAVDAVSKALQTPPQLQVETPAADAVAINRLNVSVTVTDEHTAASELDVQASVTNGSTTTPPLSLTHDGQDEFTGTVNTSHLADGTYSLVVSATDNWGLDREQQVQVRITTPSAEFQPERLDTPDSTVAGTAVEVDYTVSNVGVKPGNATLTLGLGESSERRNVSLVVGEETNATVQLAVPVAPGVKNVTLDCQATVSECQGFPTRTPLTIRNRTESTITPANATVAEGSILTFEASVTGNETAGNLPVYRTAATDGTPPSRIGSTDASGSIAVYFSQAGTYTVIVATPDGYANATATVTVVPAANTTQPPAVGPFDNQPTDTDDDGLYDDVNGDGSFDVNDMTALWANRDGSTVTNNAAAFDFNDDGDFDVNDVTKLWTLFLNQD